MVGDTAEGLETQHIVHPVLSEIGYFRRDQPALAEVGGQVDDFARRLRFLKEVGERPVILVATANPVEFMGIQPHQLVECIAHP